MGYDICQEADTITQPYGCTDYQGEWLVPRTVCETQRFHAGVDLARWDIRGKPVYATRPGTVAQVGVQYLGEQAVVIKADEGVYIELGHLDSTVVSVGQRVNVGDLLGYVGNRGNSTGPHLHVEVRTDGPFQGDVPNATVDPMPYLDSADQNGTFRGTVKAAGVGCWTHTRPGTEIDTRLRLLADGTVVTVDRWCHHGEALVVNDGWPPDDKWFHLRDSDEWMASACVLGEPSNSTPEVPDPPA